MSWKSLDFSLSHCCENHIFCIWTWVHSQDKCDSNILKNIASIELAGVGYSREGPIPWLRFFACVSPPFVPVFQYYIRLLGRGKIGSLRNPLTISAPPKKLIIYGSLLQLVLRLFLVTWRTTKLSIVWWSPMGWQVTFKDVPQHGASNSPQNHGCVHENQGWKGFTNNCAQNFRHVRRHLVSETTIIRSEVFVDFSGRM